MGGRVATGWRSLRSVGLTVAMLLVTFFTHPVFAQDSLATEPLLRLNTDRHTAPIWRIATDAQNGSLSQLRATRQRGYGPCLMGSSRRS